MRPIVINSYGDLQLARGAIRVGEATQPYHAVPLSQVKKMLSLITVTGSVFRVRSEFRFSDMTIGFCLSEPDAQEPLDVIATGRIVEETHFLFDQAITPSANVVVREEIIAADVFNPYTLDDPGADVGEDWNIIATGTLVDGAEWKDIASIKELTKATDTITVHEELPTHILSEKGYTDGNIGYVYSGTGDDILILSDNFIPSPAKVITTENIFANVESASHILGDVAWSDGSIGYVYSGTNDHVLHLEDTFITATKTITTETVTTDDVNKSDLVFLSLPKEVEIYPDDGLVLQKTKPSPTNETKKVGDAVIIKRKYKVADSCAFKDRALAVCLSDAFVGEPLTTLLYATIRETVTSGETPDNSLLETA
jgi:hypothetical protein